MSEDRYVPPAPPEITDEEYAQMTKRGPRGSRAPRTPHLEGEPISASTYVNKGCRCADCTQLATDAARERRNRRAPDPPELDPLYGEHVEGQPVSRSTYINHKCRCEDCVAENSKYGKQYAERKRKNS